MRPITRTPAALPVQSMRTYGATQDLERRQATCAEVRCPAQENGWVTTVDEATPLGRQQAAYIRERCRPAGAVLAPTLEPRARYTEGRTENGWTSFAFGPGQECFAAHTTTEPVAELFIVRNGDWRAHLGTVRTHTRGELFVEDFAEHQAGLARLIGG
jgi:hypothetical protein